MSKILHAQRKNIGKIDFKSNISPEIKAKFKKKIKEAQYVRKGE